jgi:F-type H+-transporting ATPase subunit epsilon
MRVAVVSPEDEVWTGEADMVIARTPDGELGVLAGHIPLLGVLTEGQTVRIKVGGREIAAEVDGGFISVSRDGVSILAEKADLVGT